jgi:hypothetical protein
MSSIILSKEFPLDMKFWPYVFECVCVCVCECERAKMSLKSYHASLGAVRGEDDDVGNFFLKHFKYKQFFC